jgi:hypothetical protein
VPVDVPVVAEIEQDLPPAIAEPVRPTLAELYKLAKLGHRVQARLASGTGPSLVAGIVCKGEWSEPRPISEVLECGHSHLASLATEESIVIRILE